MWHLAGRGFSTAADVKVSMELFSSLCTKILDLALCLGLTQLLHPGSEKEHQLSSSLLSTPTSRCLCSSPAAFLCPIRNQWFEILAQIPQSKITFIYNDFLPKMVATPGPVQVNCDVLKSTIQLFFKKIKIE